MAHIDDPEKWQDLQAAIITGKDNHWYHVDIYYWKGPYDVLVPTRIDRVMASDGYNDRYRYYETKMEMDPAPVMNADTYHK